MRVVRTRIEEPENQVHEEIFSSPLGVTVSGVTTTFKDGTVENAIYLDSTEDPEKFDVVGVYDNTEAGRHQSQATAFVIVRTLEILDEIKAGRAA